MELFEVSIVVKFINDFYDLDFNGSDILELACKILLFDGFDRFLELKWLKNAAIIGGYRLRKLFRVEFFYSFFNKNGSSPFW